MMLLLRRTLVRFNRNSAKLSRRAFFFCDKNFGYLQRILIIVCVFQLASFSCKAQKDSAEIITDTTILQDVRVTAFASGLKWKNVPASVAVLSKQNFSRFDGASFVPVMNTVAGVRMEERSPGSYRLSIRGSLLRSPFGVRNVKIYFNDVPLTDATGNTYLNLLDLNDIQSAEIIKGPSASFYGANTGGAVILKTDDNNPAQKNIFTAGLSGGSFGLLNESAGWKTGANKFVFNIQQSHMQADGYRQQSALRRDVVQLNGKANINSATSLSFLGFYTNLHYKTPGGITQQQMDSLPKLARQPVGSLPGAVQQNAGVYNKTYFGAASLRSFFAKGFGNTTSVVINHTDFSNPFITNYEIRKENNYSARTDFHYERSNEKISLQANAGGELQYNNSNISVYDNNAGETGNVQYKDLVHTTQYFLFAQLNVSIGNLLLQAGLSDNNIRYHYERTTDSSGIYPVKKNAGPTVSPRFGLSYAVSKNISLYTTAAKGFSPPTLAEVLPSSGSFYQSLKPEFGWNYEAGLKGAIVRNRIEYSASVYYFLLKDAIVRRNDGNGADYFVNAGGTIQKGIEVWFNAHVISSNYHFIRYLNIWNSFSYQPYRFDDYVLLSAVYSGNKLTGVPRTLNVCGVDVKTVNDYYANITFNYTSSLPVNDANTVYAKAYHLLQLKIGKQIKMTKVVLNVFAGADNLLNEVYSLGNDINAAGVRYFNPAPSANYYAGVKVSF